MGKSVNVKLDDGRITFNFENTEGEIFSSFRLNPTDINVYRRAMEVSEALQKREFAGGDDADALAADNAWIEEQFNYLLGYDATETLFGELPATTILPDGQIFAVIVIDTIIENIAPEIRKRQENADKAMNKYLAKYKK